MWPFKNKPRVAVPSGRFNSRPTDIKWTERDIERMSEALRTHGQSDSPGWREAAAEVLSFIKSPRFIEYIARGIELHANPGMCPDRPVRSSHYMMGEPHWMVWTFDGANGVAHALCHDFQNATDKIEWHLGDFHRKGEA